MTPRAKKAAEDWRWLLRMEAEALAVAPDLPPDLSFAARDLHDAHCADPGAIPRQKLRAAERAFLKALVRLVAVYDHKHPPRPSRPPSVLEHAIPPRPSRMPGAPALPQNVVALPPATPRNVVPLRPVRPR